LGFLTRLADVGIPLEILLLSRHVLERKEGIQAYIDLYVLAKIVEINHGSVALADGDPILYEGGDIDVGMTCQVVDARHHELRFEFVQPQSERPVLT
jgi:hypothetical protein